MFRRLVNLPKKHSFFLFGARGTGKSSLLEATFDPNSSLYIDLLHPTEYTAFTREPQELSRRIAALPDPSAVTVILDEVQRVPKLLDLVHHHIERDKVTFALTGSSARKLKRGAANLLAGRALLYNLFPLTHVELENHFSLPQALAWGSLPAVVNEPDEAIRRKILQSYAHTYLREEVQAEQLVRALEPFHLFLLIAAQMSGKMLNYSKIARECGASDYSVKEYFKVLEDTLLGFFLRPFHESIRKRQLAAPKFFLFDPGVKRALAGHLTLPLLPSTSAFGESFEEWLIVEIHRLCTYAENDYSLSYLRTKDDVEIDLIIERPGMPRALVEIKSTEHVTLEHIAPLAKLGRDISASEMFCLSLDPNKKMIEGVSVLPWQDGLRELGVLRS
jgi:predicted AAA+ superfamily ATPase